MEYHGNDHGCNGFKMDELLSLTSIPADTLKKLRQEKYFELKGSELEESLKHNIDQLKIEVERHNEIFDVEDNNFFQIFSSIIPKNIYNVSHAGTSANVRPNTLPGFKKASELGCDIVELDVQICKTGEVVVYHDTFLSNGDLLMDLSLEKIRNHLPEMPTLDEVLASVSRKVMLYFDLKGYGVLHPLVDKLEEAIRNTNWTPSNFLIAAFDHRYLIDLNQRKKQNPILENIKSIALIDGIPATLGKYFEDLKVSYISTTFGCCKQDFIKDVATRNIGVLVWTINHKHLMQRLLDMGVDGIVTDHPEMLASVLNEHFMKKQPILVTTNYLCASYSCSIKQWRKKLLDLYTEGKNLEKLSSLVGLPKNEQLILTSNRLSEFHTKIEEILKPLLYQQKNVMLHYILKPENHGLFHVIQNEVSKDLKEMFPFELKTLQAMFHEIGTQFN